MPNPIFVVQACAVCKARDQSRGGVTPAAYTQLVMGDAALEPLPTTRRALSATTAAPAAGRPFTTEAARWNAGVLHAEDVIRSGLTGVTLAPALAEPGPCHESGHSYVSATDRAARRLIAAWLSGVLVGDLDASASLLDADSWFCGSASTAAALPLDSARHAQVVLETLARTDGAVTMLPYALDPTPHEYRRDVVNKGSNGNTRSARKTSGSFFTPADVADHIVELALGRVEPHAGLRLLDPAAGTGVFLRSAFAKLMDQGLAVDSALSSLFAIDIDERCVDMAAFVLLVDFLLASEAPPSDVHRVWTAIRSNCVAADSLAVMNGAPKEAALFGGPAHDVAWLKASFDVIVGNPPYARLGARPDLSELQARFRSFENASLGADIYPAFVELLCGLRPAGAGSMVVPMSVGYSTTQQLRQLRAAVQEAGGAWEFEFFDRTPDALFGDDVKQRTAIVTRRAGKAYSVATSPVMRWTSRNRAALFDRVPHVELGSHDITAGVPKVGSAGQVDALRALRTTGAKLEDGLADCSRVTPPVAVESDATVFVAGTAYNWLNVYRTATSITRDIDRPTASPLTALTATSPQAADTLFALLSSRITYWIWRVETDVFHVPTGWIRALPYSPRTFSESREETLAQLGRTLWASIEHHPVQSLNGGTSTVSYCPHASPDLLDQIDAEVIAQFELQESFGSEVAAFVRDLATAGRDSHTEHGLRRALASWRED